jgi:hypothetical protein
MPPQPEREALKLIAKAKDDPGMWDGELEAWVNVNLESVLLKVEQLTKERDEARLLFKERQRELKDALRRCGQLALNRKTGAIQVLVKRTLGVEHFSPRSGQ